METEELERYRVADLLVDATTRQITRDGRGVPLPALSFDLFLALLRRAPAVVSTDGLMALVWPGRVVNAETVAKRVELVREALGDDSRTPRYIALVRRRGYRLIPTPERLTPERADRNGVDTRIWLRLMSRQQHAEAWGAAILVRRDFMQRCDGGRGNLAARSSIHLHPSCTPAPAERASTRQITHR